MGNILTAITAIVKIKSTTNPVVDTKSSSTNRATQMGDALEDFIKNAFADCLGEQDDSLVKKARHNTFSYLGNSTNPPDAMLNGSDAIEIKKLKTLGTSQLQLNSSYPKNKLYSDNPKICKACRTCEVWKEKDMLYVIGQVNDTKLNNLLFVYGDLFCDSPEIYEKVEGAIKTGLKTLDGVEIADTNELGRVNGIDHLEISDLRIRGMWLIKSPLQYFDYLTKDISNYRFKLVAIIPETKYDSFNNKTEFEIFCANNGITIKKIDVDDPQNPAKIIKAILITFSIT